VLEATGNVVVVVPAVEVGVVTVGDAPPPIVVNVFVPVAAVEGVPVPCVDEEVAVGLVMGLGAGAVVTEEEVCAD